MKRAGDPASVGIATISTIPITNPISLPCIVSSVPGVFRRYSDVPASNTATATKTQK